MRLAFIAFSDRGHALAERLASALGGTVTRGGADAGLAEWAAESFCGADGLVFIGAAGIAVRAIAPHVNSKTSDPAVVVVDELARYAIPILSGHLGGANDLARRISTVCGAEAVVTTATDRNGVFAVDEWARRQGCAVVNPERIKVVSSKLLAGGTVLVRSDYEISGEPPEGVVMAHGDCDVRLSVRAGGGGTLRLVPRILVLGVGCRKGTPSERIERRFADFMERSGYAAEGVRRVCTVDLKANEAGLLDFCRRHGFDFTAYPAGKLAAVRGSFTASEYVLRTVGVDNVCERSAVLGSGGALLCRKDAEDGVTLALAAAPYAPDWRWAYE